MMSVATRNAVLDSILRGGTNYISLHDGDPGITGADEITGGSYVRKPLTLTQWNAAASAASPTNVSLSWTDLPAVTITHIGLWSAVSGGTFKMGGDLAVAKVVPAGESFLIIAAALVASLEAGSV